MSQNKRADNAVNQYEQRLRDTRRKLVNALERLIAGQSTHPNLKGALERFTVARLAREAGVGRNAIYTNHRELLDDLGNAALKASSQGTLRKDKVEKQYMAIAAMKLNERRMITENAVLLKRAQHAELEAARHRNHNARLIAERDAALRPSLIPFLKRR